LQRSLASFKFEIEKNQRYADNIQRKVAEEVAVGMFFVDCRTVKNALAVIGSKIRSECLQLLRDQAYEELTQVKSR
jgi:hypothetical protein